MLLFLASSVHERWYSVWEMKTITTGVPLNHLGQIRKYKLPVSPALSAGVRRVLPHLADSHRVLLLLTVLQCFLFIYKLTLIQHRLSAIALTRGTGRMQLPRLLTREHSLERTGKCFRKSFELRKKEYVRIWINYELRIWNLEYAYFTLLAPLTCMSWLGIT